FTTLLVILQGCGVASQVGQAYNMVQCRYDYNSVSNLTLGGIDLSRGIGISTTPQILALLSGSNSSIPMSFTVNLDVTNPNPNTAALHGLAYILQIDNVEFTRGSVNQALHIPSGGTQILPLSIGLDLATLLSGNSKDAVQNIIKNFIGTGSEKSKVTLQIKPSFRIGSQTVSAPQYIPISFSFGGN
ncbi:MAG: LEA type 2 family protein, partial [Bacteroides sp.]|nr:LEA type 2 family protein [Bacteroides sp.]